MSSTPIYDFVKQISDSTISRFFMPGHKGRHPFDPFFQDVSRYDITEIEGADVLAQAEGIIGESEELAATLFGSRATLYSTQGSTLGIQAMVSLISGRGDTVIAGRNAHMAFYNACLLLRINVRWVLPSHTDPYGICGAVTPDQVEQALCDCPKAAAVYLTSPDYLGNTADINAIAGICKKHGVPLCCDNAHGAYLTLGEAHPIKQGAAICCDSAHKTLPVLTGGAYLHLGENCPWTKQEAKERMALFSSSSPSYLILASLDLANRYLAEEAQRGYERLRGEIMEMRRLMKQKGIACLDNQADYAKLTIDAGRTGWDGMELAAKLRESGIEPEYANPYYVVLMATPFLTQRDWNRLSEALKKITPGRPITWEDTPYCLPEAVLPAFQAARLPWESVPADLAVGRVSAQTVAACPPGVPVVTAGERIHEQIKNICKKSGNFTLKVLK